MTAKFAIHCAAAATPSALARIRFGNISPSSTQTSGPQVAPKQITNRFAPTSATMPHGFGRLTAPPAPVCAWLNETATAASAIDHAGGAGEQHRPAADLVDDRDRDERDGDVEDRGERPRSRTSP